MSREYSKFAQSTNMMGRSGRPFQRPAIHSFQPVTSTMSGSASIARSHCSRKLPPFFQASGAGSFAPSWNARPRFPFSPYIALSPKRSCGCCATDTFMTLFATFSPSNTRCGREKSIQGQPPFFDFSFGHCDLTTVKNARISGEHSSSFATMTGLPSNLNHVSFAKPGP